MATVHRHSFTRLTASTQNDEQFGLNIVFVHGLRGHPRRTWETAAVPSTDADASTSASNGGSNTTKKSKGLRSLFRRTDRSSATATAQAQGPSSSPASIAPPLPSTVFWPEEYLAPDIPQACVVSQHGRDLSVRLERDLDNEKPLAFVAHSLGGIIVKDAIRRLESIRQRTKLIIFLGTPHRGSAYAGWGQIASNLARLALQDSNKKLLETLEVNLH
ncbi:hypothetical protein IQ07DRAFT_686211 [Pyrenochaeta sp. DS3sAY3a]|nr:hypothetical protein IQ07DRAFT_686211 [Pyrenochaeta sp. DS3sAY3a]